MNGFQMGQNSFHSELHTEEFKKAQFSLKNLEEDVQTNSQTMFIYFNSLFDRDNALHLLISINIVHQV